MDLLSIGKAALSIFVPGAGPIMKAVGEIGKVIGGKAGKKIQDGVSAVADGLAEAGKAPLSPEQQVELEKSKQQAEIELAELGYRKEKLVYDDVAGGRDVVKTALVSTDPVVRQARPRMMVLLGKFAVGYTVGTPLLIGLLAFLKVDVGTINLVVKLILWQGATLWSAFMTSFTGYTVARSADKRSLAKMENGEATSNLMQMISKVGKMVQ